MPAEAGLSPAPEGAFDHAGVRAVDSPTSAAGSRWAIVSARFNGGIVNDLFAGAVDTLLEAGAKPEHIHAVTVPGAFELPLAARELAVASHYAGVIALGCVIRGETAHFEYVSGGATDGLLRVSLDHGIPIGFGVLTVETLEQARARSSRAAGGHNVGADAAAATIELAGFARVTRSS
ncbi:MAG: 6,7-dimethyl-8-ribityllumazine synthase [Thermoleophilia bacterium]|nr:6,7-dimethyl-8-ribityllumazine synthase [Thermoleophilia bacterium]